MSRTAGSWLPREARERGRSAHLADAAEVGFTPSRSIEVRFKPAGARVAGSLAIAEVTVRDRALRAAGLVVRLSVSRLPRDTAIEDAATGPRGTYARPEEAGHRIGSFAEHGGARAGTPPGPRPS
ncbi:hypothetical protein [Amycolatopsis sp. cmx-4-83]|uniref:hypothetical protein n=1 Tax=Amycolatopsis sp. cmx-4-83 TaxID=2790940 RepID=UPI00397CFF78